MAPQLHRRLWQSTEISRSGEFSRERLHAFEDYARKTSWLRACVVCLLTPLPALLFVIVIEAALPLAPLTAPLKDHHNLTIRVFLCAFAVSYATINMVRQFAPDIPLPRLAILRVATLTAALYAASVVAYTVLWGRFPVPFVMPQTIVFFWVSLAVSIRVYRFKGFNNASPDQNQQWKLCVKQYAVVLGWVGLLQVVYPAYGALFVSLKGTTQVLVVAFPSLLKIFMKAKIASLCRKNVVSIDETIPQLVNFTVELFHALYITNCMQTTATPLRTTLVIILMDFVPSFFVARRLLRFNNQSSQPGGSLHPVSVSPAPIIGQPRQGHPTVSLNDKDLQQLHHRRLLFTCEYHVLVEYIECVIPMTYAIYIGVLYHLPNAAYYPHMQRLKMPLAAVQSPSPLVTSVSYIMLFVALEFISLVAFGTLVRDKLGISCLKLLAFTLETLAEMVQMKLFTWMPYCIFLPVVHGGVDFTLKFDWKDAPTN